MTRGLDFVAATHTYTLDGIPVSRSVTGVLHAAGLLDFSHIPPPIRAASLARGTIVHQALHYFNEGDLDVARFLADFPDYGGYLDAWMTFCRQRHFHAVLCEHRIVSQRYDVAGTIDCLGILDAQAVLLDFTTGDPTELGKDLQTAGYLLIAREYADDDPPLAAFFREHMLVRRFAVALRPDGTFRVDAYTNPCDARQFITLVEAQRIIDARRRH